MRLGELLRIIREGMDGVEMKLAEVAPFYVYAAPQDGMTQHTPLAGMIAAPTRASFPTTMTLLPLRVIVPDVAFVSDTFLPNADHQGYGVSSSISNDRLAWH